MDSSALIQYIRPELLILIPILYGMGICIKKTRYINDEFIPYILGFVSIFLSGLYILAVSDISGGYQDILIVIFNILIQGLCCAGVAVYCNQLGKQTKKLIELPPVKETSESGDSV